MVDLNDKSLGDICDEGGGIIRTGPFGSQLHQSDYTDIGIPVVMPKDITEDKVDDSEIARISEEDALRLSQHQLMEGDIVYGRRGNIGRHALISVKEKGWLCGTGCLRIHLGGKSPLKPVYLHYYLKQPHVTEWIYNQAIGATMPNLNTSILRSVIIQYPRVELQSKIAAILSAYDDLIENNFRRIKILEEMAQNLYREWFVNFRFPGHEKVKMVDSPLGKIPEGWEVGTLNDVLATLESGSRPKGGIDPEARGVPSIGAENIIGLGRYDYSKEKFVTREFFDNMNRGHIQSADVLLYKDGAQIGRKSMFRDGFPHAECCINEHVFILRTNGRCSQTYLFFWLDQPDMTQNIINLNANAAQPGINQSGVRGLPILLPPTPLLEVAEQVLEPMLAALFNYAKKNNVLRQTRDLLLPKLISGEVDVSELDITVPEEASTL